MIVTAPALPGAIGGWRRMDWNEGKGGASALFWNPGAISYLAELLLALGLAVYFAARVVRERRQGGLYPPTLLLAVLMAAVVPMFLTSMFRVLVAGGWVSYAMPWSALDAPVTLAMPWASVFGGIVTASLILLAYQFPGPLRGARREFAVVGLSLVLLVAVECAIAVRADLAIMRREAWWRPDWLAGWMSLGTIWAAIVFWRQLASAQQGGSAAAAGWPARIGGGIAAIWQSPANREATVARAFVFLSLLPIVHTTILFLPNKGQFGLYPFDILLCWSGLVQLVGLALVLVGYLPERSSFLFKLTAVSLAVLMAAITGAAWMIAPAYATQFRPSEMVSSGEALNFVSTGAGTYAVQPQAFLPELVRGQAIGDEGARVALPFAFEFYGKVYRALYVSGNGTIGFDHIPRPIDAAFGAGVQPAIYPLLVASPESGSRITALSDEERLIVTRFDRCTEAAADRCYRVQTILHADGRIDVHYLQVPRAPAFLLFNPLHGPWLVGITPGGAAGAGTPVLRDYYRAFLTYLDRLYAPFVPFSIGTAMALLLAMPLLFRRFLVRPLDRLLRGIRAFRDGELETQVAVSFNDEIGYLTDSFNEMAREQHAMTRGLESRVADRVAEIADMTVRNAQLEERNRLSADLHDAVAQTLSSASLLASALPAQLHGSHAGVDHAERVARLNRHALNEMRVLLTELRGEGGGDWSLADRLAELAASFEALHALRIRCELGGDAPLPAEVRSMFYRVAQESLNNVVKHSGAGIVELSFDALGDRALLVVRDEGCGFDPAALVRGGRLGLAIMRDRARLIGATLEIESSPDQGCRITLIWIDPGA